jgi:carboxyl-terminal processing protease
MARLTLSILLAGLLIATVARAQDCLKPLQLFNKISQEHIEPKELSDSVSAEIFDELFIALDPYALLFFASDWRALNSYRYKLDDEINRNSCTFINRAEQVYREKVKRTRHLVDSLMQRPFDFSTQEFWEPGYEETEAATYRELKVRLRLSLKYEVLTTIYRLNQLEGKIELDHPQVVKLLPTAQEKVKQHFLKMCDKWMEVSVPTTYLKSIAHVFDPHTEYFTENEMKTFEESIHAERPSFGIDLNENSLGQVRIARLVPGGPAWKSGQLHQGDLLARITWKNKEAIDLADYDSEEVDALLHDPNQTEAELVVIKSSGESNTVTLVKEKIENTENSVSSFILKGERTIGYIQLPGFFTDESDLSLNGCANEVSKEIIKLNRLKIDALILDLRFNGGGSLREAVELSGIFIDAGPTAVLEDKGQPAVSLRDANKGLAFAGPLVIMVNRASASASELVAAALQDYKRAIIVGSQSFGKATGQVVLPLNAAAPDDFVKVTISRIYRLNQQSLQGTGITPDITLPDLSEAYVFGEGAMRYALPAKATTKKTYYTPSTLPSLNGIVASSKQRVSSEKGFQSIQALQAIFAKPFPLQEAAFIATFNDITTHLKNTSGTDPAALPYSVQVNSLFLDNDSYKRNVAEGHKKEIEASMYIKETYLLLTELLKSSK